MLACALHAGLFVGGCTGGPDRILAPAEAVPVDERVVLSIAPRSYEIRRGNAAYWQGKEYTSWFERWNDERCAGCFRLVVPPGSQRVEIRNTWSNGSNELLVADFVAIAGKHYVFHTAQRPDPSLKPTPGLSAAEAAGWLVLSATLQASGLYVFPLLLNQPHERPKGMLCYAWVECEGEVGPVVSLTPLPMPK